MMVGPDTDAMAAASILDGTSLNHMPIHRRARMGLSYLPQEASIFRKLTVAENVQAVLELRGLDRWNQGRAS